MFKVVLLLFLSINFAFAFFFASGAGVYSELKPLWEKSNLVEEKTSSNNIEIDYESELKKSGVVANRISKNSIDFVAIPNNELFVSYAIYSNFYEFDMMKGNLLKQKNTSSEVYTISKNKKQIASITAHGEIYLKDITKKDSYKKYKARLINPGNIRNIKYSKKAKKILLLERNRGSLNKLYLFDLKSKKIVNEFELYAPINNIIDVDINPNGQTFAILIKSLNKLELELQVMSLNNLKKQKVLTMSKDVNKIKYTKDGKQIILGTKQGDIKLISINNGKILKTLKGHTNAIKALDFDSTGNKLVSASNDKTVKVWNLQKGILLNDFKGHQSSLESVAISPNASFVVSGSKDGWIRVWDTNRFKVNTPKKRNIPIDKLKSDFSEYFIDEKTSLKIKYRVENEKVHLIVSSFSNKYSGKGGISISFPQFKNDKRIIKKESTGFDSLKSYPKGSNLWNGEKSYYKIIIPTY